MNSTLFLEDSAEAGFLVERILASCGSRIVVTSCEDGAGTTFLCKILAHIASDRLRKRVIYVDLNLRHPAPNDLFESSNNKIESRSVEANFQSLQGWEKRNCVEKLLELPDPDSLIVIDTSPLSIFNRNNVHPVNIAEWTRDFILVVRSGSTRRSALSEARSLLNRHGIELRGAVFNARPGEGVSDPASVTRWRDAVRVFIRAQNELPLLRKRLRTKIHALRVFWRLARPGIRRQLLILSRSRFIQIARQFARKVRPGVATAARRTLSSLRGKLDHWLARKDGPWTKS